MENNCWRVILVRDEPRPDVKRHLVSCYMEGSEEDVRALKSGVRAIVVGQGFKVESCRQTQNEEKALNELNAAL